MLFCLPKTSYSGLFLFTLHDFLLKYKDSVFFKDTFIRAIGANHIFWLDCAISISDSDQVMHLKACKWTNTGGRFTTYADVPLWCLSKKVDVKMARDTIILFIARMCEWAKGGDKKAKKRETILTPLEVHTHDTIDTRIRAWGTEGSLSWIAVSGASTHDRRTNDSVVSAQLSKVVSVPHWRYRRWPGH